MFDLQLWDLLVGFVACLVLVNLFPKLSLAGGWIVRGAIAAWQWAMGKIGRGSTPMIIVMFSVLLMGFGCLDPVADVAKEPMVDVKIYRHIESGNLIYCETGELTGDLHEYVGEGRIGESTAVAC